MPGMELQLKQLTNLGDDAVILDNNLLLLNLGHGPTETSGATLGQVLVYELNFINPIGARLITSFDSAALGNSKLNITSFDL